MTKTNKTTLKESDLNQFYGTVNRWKSPAPWIPFVYSDGVRYVAQNGNAYWLLDAIGSWQIDKRIKNDQSLQDIQFWSLTVMENRAAVLLCERDEGDVVITQKIELTDFPLPKIRFYLCDMFCYWQHEAKEGPRMMQNFGSLILPSEY